jgi:hypothetical protein
MSSSSSSSSSCITTLIEDASKQDAEIARMIFMRVVLTLLGYKYYGNSMESSFYKNVQGQRVQYCFESDGTITYSNGYKTVMLFD